MFFIKFRIDKYIKNIKIFAQKIISYEITDSVFLLWYAENIPFYKVKQKIKKFFFLYIVYKLKTLYIVIKSNN